MSRVLSWVIIGAATGLSLGCTGVPKPNEVERAGVRARSDVELVLRTADGRQWEGAEARIDVYSAVSSQPAVAKLSLAVVDARGQMLGIYAELDPIELSRTSWQIKLDGLSPTGPGMGILSYGTFTKPRIAESGKLTITVRESRLSGSLESNVAAATLEGRYAVECFVSAQTMKLTLDGRLSGGEVLVSDENFETDFCRPFKALAGH